MTHLKRRERETKSIFFSRPRRQSAHFKVKSGRTSAFDAKKIVLVVPYLRPYARLSLYLMHAIMWRFISLHERARERNSFLFFVLTQNCKHMWHVEILVYIHVHIVHFFLPTHHSHTCAQFLIFCSVTLTRGGGEGGRKIWKSGLEERLDCKRNNNEAFLFHLFCFLFFSYFLRELRIWSHLAAHVKGRNSSLNNNNLSNFCLLFSWLLLDKGKTKVSLDSLLLPPFYLRRYYERWKDSQLLLFLFCFWDIFTFRIILNWTYTSVF